MSDSYEGANPWDAKVNTADESAPSAVTVEADEDEDDGWGDAASDDFDDDTADTATDDADEDDDDVDESGDMADLILARSGVVTLTDEEHIAQAKDRLSRLSRSFGDTVSLIAEMDVNRDWEYLTREDGTAYRDLAELVHDALDMSRSYVNRLLQTHQHLHSPLSSIVVSGTVIPVTSKQAADLGDEGMDAVVNLAQEAADELGELDADQLSSLINDILGDRKERQAEKKAAKEAKAAAQSDDDGDDDYGDDGWNAVDPDQGPGGGGGNPFKKEAKDDFSSSGFDSPNSAYGPDVDPDLDIAASIKEIFSSGADYRTEQALATLDPDLRKIAEAINVLAAMNVGEVAEDIGYQQRGLERGMGGALRNLQNLQMAITTAPWLMTRIG